MDQYVHRDRLEEIKTDHQDTIRTYERHKERAEKELGKQKRMLRDLQEKNTLQSETIERQREETKKLQDQVRRQQQVIQDMEAFIVNQLGIPALETFYQEGGHSRTVERKETDPIQVYRQPIHTQPDPAHTHSDSVHTQNQLDSIPTQKRPHTAQHKPTPLGESQHQNILPSQDRSEKSTYTLSKKDPNHSTTRLTSSTKNQSVQPYVETVRKKDERAKLHGASCKCCSKYYNASGALPGPDGRLLTPEERIQSSSRHRSRFKRERTPPAFWDDLDFISSQQVNGQKSPDSPRRSNSLYL
ncbi:hypothetical protein O0I10_007144 [Lichtheimia ornata]|uniref:DNA endonuclease activator Ctp1 C-terminal domain-containing protein n=1 Tax=Lichtheimia ornata TaxID=688661 RepID=A0AAD7XWH4_9FUNG|nr:uncharacterized protein O0I10_007144 [Lichtheimia ornata]KAJ8657065.1 hypothetical protein O0I10_007144 [Lichtheimia ornata]